MPSPLQSQFPLRIIEQGKTLFYRDAKRNTVLVGLVAMMLVMWGRLLFSGPATATASLIRRSVAAMSDAPLTSARLSSNSPVLDWLGQPRRIVDRNLFAIQLNYYGRVADHPATGSSRFSDPLTDSQADEQREQQILRERLQIQAAKLKLQTTLLGSTPRAVINGQLLKIGDVIDGFRIEKIEPRQIDVEQNGLTFQIEMN